MFSRIQCASILFLSLLGLAGCGKDLLWWPGFNAIGANYVDTIPVNSVATEVQCEIFSFIRDESPQVDKNHPALLDPKKGASVSLTLETDLTGSVQYIGIDLSKLGFPSLATVVAASNKVPSLQAKGTIHDTLSAEVDFVVAQSPDQQIAGAKPPPAMMIRERDATSATKYVMASFNPVPKSNPVTYTPQPQPPMKPTPPYFPHADCQHQNPIEHAYLQLWLEEWLQRFKTSHEPSIQFVCNTKVTLKTQFQIAADISAGVNPLIMTPLIVPISGTNIDANPSYQHSMQISFALQDPSPRHANYCGGLEGTQPNVSIGH